MAQSGEGSNTSGERPTPQQVNLNTLNREMGEHDRRILSLEKWRERMEERATRIFIIGLGAGFSLAGMIVGAILLQGLGF